uniref:Uncharacterized protein n=1 Tax=Meloidogyne enterolobii TaxID=390850 RepID=A0A6V7XXM1_MELEN|nr:unnamed protein product [Meloidogyne enterolobii]
MTIKNKIRRAKLPMIVQNCLQSRHLQYYNIPKSQDHLEGVKIKVMRLFLN